MAGGPGCYRRPAWPISTSRRGTGDRGHQVPRLGRAASAIRGLAIDLSPLKRSRDFRVLWFGQLISLIGRQITVGLLPAPLRDQYGLGWDGHRRRALLLAGLGSRLVLPRVPGLIRRVH